MCIPTQRSIVGVIKSLAATAGEAALTHMHIHTYDLQEFVEWCDRSHLELNVNKTKEMVVTFSNKQMDLAAAVDKGGAFIHGKPVELVKEYTFLVTIFDHLLQTLLQYRGDY